MPIYQYTALDATGRKKKGVIEAQDEREAKSKLREQGLMVSDLHSKAASSSKEALRGESLLAITMQLSQLVNAGVPLYESLIAIEEQYRSEPFHRVLLSLCDQIKAGSSLSEAMTSFPESFDKLYRAMIAAGEAAGALGLVLERLHQLLEKQMKMKKEIVTAMIYPGILATFSLLVIGVLLGFVVPSIEGIFADRELNAFTNAVLSISHFAREKWWLYIPLLVGIATYLVFQFRSAEGKVRMQRWMVKLPVVKQLVINAAMARFARTMATLQQGGVTVIESLRMASETMHNVALEEEMHVAETKIIEGSSLSRELKKSRYIPAMVTRMLAVGEDTGNTVVMLQKIADMYEDTLEKSISRMMALAQPVILIVMGGVIGAVMVAILLPLTDVASFAGG